MGYAGRGARAPIIDSINPMGSDGFEFVEYTAPDPMLLDRLFRRMGFRCAARHRSKDVTLYRQGDINFIVNNGAYRSDYITIYPDSAGQNQLVTFPASGNSG